MSAIFNCKFSVGDRVMVDADRPNRSEVTITGFTPEKMFATVKADDGYEWQTMSNRLSEIKTSKP